VAPLCQMSLPEVAKFYQTLILNCKWQLGLKDNIISLNPMAFVLLHHFIWRREENIISINKRKERFN